MLLLTWLLIFEQHIEIPTGLQTIGRMHPLVLHLPIGFIIVLALLQVIKGQLEPNSFQVINKVLLLLTVFSAVLATFMGFLLSLEPGYDSPAMQWHKWAGIFVGYLVTILLYTYQYQKSYKILLFSTLIAIVVAGHFGANITHGEDFLVAPLFPEKKSSGDGSLFASHIQPILENKCVQCHNANKHKGDLNLTSWEKIQEGGENGKVWEVGNALNSALITRALLPLENEEHMPPEGKPQLTGDELLLLQLWIDYGADNNVKLKDLKSSDSLFVLANKLQPSTEDAVAKPSYNFDFVSKEKVIALNNPYRSVVQKSQNSPALDVNIYGKLTYKPELLTDILAIKTQVVSLNLANLPLNEKDFEAIGKLSNLEKLNVNFTQISDNVLSSLLSCSNLKSISLAGTNISIAIKDVLQALPALETIFVWNTGLSQADIAQLTAEFPQLKIENGYVPNANDEMQLAQPSLTNKNGIISSKEAVTLFHKLNGVEIRFTTDNSEPTEASELYKEPLFFEKSTVLKAKAFKQGWLPSDSRKTSFLIEGIKPDSILLKHQPNKKYSANGASSLIDNKKGNFSDLPLFYWLGYIDQPLVAELDFGNEPPTLSALQVSYCIIAWQRIMAPKSIELWGGNSKENLVKLSTINPVQTSDDPGRDIKSVTLPFPSSNYRYYKVVVNPVSKLPLWHGSKGNKAWVFVDEILFN